MSTIVSLIREYQALHLGPGAAADLFERALQSVLEAEGPPPEPIGGISGQVTSAIARSPKGRPLFLCHSWETAGWVCLMLDLPPVVMGRPVFLRSPDGRGPGRVVTDYQSQKFQRRIAAACFALRLAAPPEPSRLCCLLDSGRLFVAWKRMERTAPLLKGDLDNYAKNVMDGLQRARIVPNDRTIAAIAFTRTALPVARESLDDVLIRQLLEVRAEHPKLRRRALAKRAGVSQRQCKRLLDLAEARTAQQTGTAGSERIDFKAIIPPPPPITPAADVTSPRLDQVPGAQPGSEPAAEPGNQGEAPQRKLTPADRRKRDRNRRRALRRRNQRTPLPIATVATLVTEGGATVVPGSVVPAVATPAQLIAHALPAD